MPSQDLPSRNLLLALLSTGKRRASDDSTCSICLDSGDKWEDRAVILHDAHIFGLSCIEQWLKHNNTCPTCRVVVYEKDKGRNLEARVGSFRHDVQSLPRDDMIDVEGRRFRIFGLQRESVYIDNDDLNLSSLRECFRLATSMHRRNLNPWIFSQRWNRLVNTRAKLYLRGDLKPVERDYSPYVSGRFEFSHRDISEEPRPIDSEHLGRELKRLFRWFFNHENSGPWKPGAVCHPFATIAQQRIRTMLDFDDSVVKSASDLRRSLESEFDVPFREAPFQPLDLPPGMHDFVKELIEITVRLHAKQNVRPRHGRSDRETLWRVGFGNGIVHCVDVLGYNRWD